MVILKIFILFTIFFDKKVKNVKEVIINKNEEKIFDCNSSGIPHKHCMDVIIAEKI